MQTTKTTQIVIVGGGFSGSMTALHIFRNIKDTNLAVAVTICEPRRELGKGLAYSTQCDQHLLNVPASGMSAFDDDSEHFLRYARALDSSIEANSFVSRRVYGNYIKNQLEKAVQAANRERVSLAHIEQNVIDIERASSADSGFLVRLEGGSSMKADFVVLATGNLSGKRPGWISSLPASDQRYIHNPWEKGAIERIGRQETVLLVGTGLTAIDKIVELHEQRHEGKIYALSRHGLTPQPHVAAIVGQSKKNEVPHGSVLKALRTLRQRIAATAGSAHRDQWRLIFDGLRSQTQDWWHALPAQEKKRFLRHLRTYFDVHRHRMAPEIAALIDQHLASRQLQIIAARMISVQEDSSRSGSTKRGHGKLIVTIHRRETGSLEQLAVDRVLNCTGPQATIEATENDLLRRLVANGIASKNELGTGLSIARDGQLLDCGGAPVPGIFAIGPLLQGELLESIAVPELRGQASALGRRLSTLAGQPPDRQQRGVPQVCHR